MDELPDLSDIFETEDTNVFAGKTKPGEVEIQISKEDNKWITADFIDVAISGIGIHIMTPLQFEISSEELNKMKIKFVKKLDSGKSSVLKQFPVLVRWQETDSVSGNLKIGLHFGSEYENDNSIRDILKQLKKASNKKK